MGSRLGITIVCAALCVLSFAALADARRILGTKGPDRINGSGQDDRIHGRAGADTIWAGGGDDRVSGGKHNDRLIGSAGADTLTGGPGRDEFNVAISGASAGGAGDDRILARDGTQDLIDCGAGIDTVFVDGSEDGVFDCEVILEPGQPRAGRSGG